MENATELTPIAAGADSRVYLVADKVFKYYQAEAKIRPIPQEQLELYKKVTNQGAEISKKNPFSFHLGENFSLPVRINPIEKLEFDQSKKQWFTVSPFVDGLTLRDLIKKPSKLKRKLEEEGATFTSIFSDLSRLSRQIEDKLGVRGVDIMRWNSMLVPSDNKEGFEIVITDISSTVRKIKKRARG